MKFRCNPAINANELAETYARKGRVRIESFLPEKTAESLAKQLGNRDDWKQMLRGRDGVVELDRKFRAQLPKEKIDQLESVVRAQGRTGFQFRYEAIRVPDNAAERAASDDILCRFAEWMSEEPQLELFRKIAGVNDLAFADAQATAYKSGDFLTGHDDQIPGKNRRAAYVLGLTPMWRLEWGGLLLFHTAKDEVEGLIPSYNSLDIFSVGQMHSVSEVNACSAGDRMSITGWLRAGNRESG